MGHLSIDEKEEIGMVTTSTQDLGIHLQNFTDFQRRAAGRNLPWLRTLREDAFARFAETGFPTTHDEDWRFTNVAPITRTQFRLPGKTFVQLPPAELNSWNIEGSAARLVFVNGRFAPELSSLRCVNRLREIPIRFRSNSAITRTRSAMHLSH
jgi:Fe-S cluster assembly protein SufD